MNPKAKREELESCLESIERQIRMLQVNEALLNAELTGEKIDLNDTSVSDHAVVRYLERKLNLDIEQIKKDLVGGRENIIESIQSGRIKTQEGYTLIIKNGSVVTIY